jgi:prophage tail gpP-like protein
MPSPAAGQNYTAQSGDTLRRIAAIAYGNEMQWSRIAAANGITNPDLIFPGQVIFIPGDEARQQAQAAVATNRFADRKKEQVTLVLDGRELPCMSGRFARGIDVLASSYNATIAWIPGKNKWLDEKTARGSFADSQLYIGSELVCTARLYSRENSITKDSITKTLEFFSVTADLVDSHIPPSEGEILHSDLKQIADLLCAKHGFPVTFKDDPGAAFDMVEAKRENVETVAKFLQRLAAQRGLFISCDERGGVVFQKAANSGESVARIEYKGKVATEYKAKFDDRLRFSKYFASSMSGDGQALNATATDPNVPAARQILFEANDADSGSIQSAAEWKMLRLELEALSVNFPVSDWFDASGKLWKPNTIVTCHSPVLDIPEPKPFVICQVELVWTASERTALLNLVPPLSVDGGKLKMGVR